MSLKLAPNERKKIENRRREERDSRIWRRLSALLWLGEGVTEEEVAKRLGVLPRQVRQWVKIYRAEGLKAMCELHYKGRVPRLNEAQCEELKEEIAKGEFRTSRQIAEWIDKRFGIQFSESGVKELLSASMCRTTRSPAFCGRPTRWRRRSGWTNIAAIQWGREFAATSSMPAIPSGASIWSSTAGCWSDNGFTSKLARGEHA